MFLKFSWSLQENTCVRVSEACKYIKKTLIQVFSCEFWKNFFRAPLVAASWSLIWMKINILSNNTGHMPGPNLDLFCVQQSNAVPLFQNCTKLYAKHLEEGLIRGWRNIWGPSFQQSVLFSKKIALFGLYWTLP